MPRDSIPCLHRNALAIAVTMAIVVASISGCGVKGPLKPAQPPAPAVGTLPSEAPHMPTPPLPARESPGKPP